MLYKTTTQDYHLRQLSKQFWDRAILRQSSFETEQFLDRAIFGQSNFRTKQLMDKTIYGQSKVMGFDTKVINLV